MLQTQTGLRYMQLVVDAMEVAGIIVEESDVTTCYGYDNGDVLYEIALFKAAERCPMFARINRGLTIQFGERDDKVHIKITPITEEELTDLVKGQENDEQTKINRACIDRIEDKIERYPIINGLYMPQEIVETVAEYLRQKNHNL